MAFYPSSSVVFSYDGLLLFNSFLYSQQQHDRHRHQVINYGISDQKIAERAEPMMHLIAFGWAFFTALYSAVKGLLNNANLWCWIAPLPGDCLDSRRYGDDQANCNRGDNAWIYRWAFYFAPLWFCIFFASTWSCCWVTFELRFGFVVAGCRDQRTNPFFFFFCIFLYYFVWLLLS